MYFVNLARLVLDEIKKKTYFTAAEFKGKIDDELVDTMAKKLRDELARCPFHTNICMDEHGV